MKACIPLGRLGEPSHISNAYLFLASDVASFLSAETLRGDGRIDVGTSVPMQAGSNTPDTNDPPEPTAAVPTDTPTQ
jgi:Enoyl-(Acyl carrier protein) reductase